MSSLVKKDVGLLDAFGKGASDDIQNGKHELYSQMTYDPSSKSSLIVDAEATPPLSPKHGEWSNTLIICAFGTSDMSLLSIGPWLQAGCDLLMRWSAFLVILQKSW